MIRVVSSFSVACNVFGLSSFKPQFYFVCHPIPSHPIPSHPITTQLHFSFFVPSWKANFILPQASQFLETVITKVTINTSTTCFLQRVPTSMVSRRPRPTICSRLCWKCSHETPEEVKAVGVLAKRR